LLLSGHLAAGQGQPTSGDMAALALLQQEEMKNTGSPRKLQEKRGGIQLHKMHSNC